jgi:hypothetical protein
MTSETLVNFYQSTRRYNPEDSYLRTQPQILLSCVHPIYYITTFVHYLRFQVVNRKADKLTHTWIMRRETLNRANLLIF